MKLRPEVYLPLGNYASEARLATLAFGRVLAMRSFDLARVDFPTILGELRYRASPDVHVLR